MAMSGTALWALWFAVMLVIAAPSADSNLEHHTRWMKPAALATSTLIVAGGIAWAVTVWWVKLEPPRISVAGQASTEILEAIEGTFGYNDATALCQQAAENFLAGKNPYAVSNIVTATQQYGVSALKRTPLRRGQLSESFPYPSIDQQEAVWADALKQPGVIPVEFESRFNYPAGSFLLLTPFLLAGMRDVRLAYILLLLLAIAYVVLSTRGGMRWALVGSLLISLELPNLLAIGETGALQFPFLLLGWVLAKKSWRTSAIMMGVAITIKQVSWLYMLFYLVFIFREMGWRRLLGATGIAGGVFMAVNAYFIALDPILWAGSIAAPVTDPMFPLGVGVVTLVTSGVWDLQSPAAFSALSMLCLVVALVWYYYNCRRSPYAGPVLAVLPFFFAWRSMWSYFFFTDFILLASIVANEYGHGAAHSRASFPGATDHGADSVHGS